MVFSSFISRMVEIDNFPEKWTYFGQNYSAMAYKANTLALGYDEGSFHQRF